uniref:Uncharacterized protein n=1 Tax=Arundo donax TaxID=35708 RepID=A0A0A9A5V9_ARUDO
MPSPLGEHTGLHHLAGLEEGEDSVEEDVRQIAQPVPGGAAAAAARTGPLPRGSIHVGTRITRERSREIWESC